VKRVLTVGLIVVATVCVGATVWSVASTVADGVTVAHSYDERCAQPSNVVFPSGSCAPPLRAEDFAARRATLRLTLTRTGARMIDYTFENRTSKLRSFDWTMVELTTPNGARLGCGGDATAERLPAPPGTRKRAAYPCTEVVESGRYSVSYGGLEVAHLDVPSSVGSDRVRPTA
jgi:hypothetical protein